MKSAVLIASLALGGCFYIDPINQRPSLDIKQDNVGPIFRGEMVSFTAVVVDPDDQDVDLVWHLYLCTDATSFSDCDSQSALAGDKRSFSFEVPMKRLDDATPVDGIRIVLDGIDDHGAVAKPPDQLQLPVLDRNPDLTMRKDSTYKQMNNTFVVGMPIDFYAIYGDGDDTLDTLRIDWNVYAPQQVTEDFIDGVAPPAPDGKIQVAKILKPQVIGEWTVEATVTDPRGNKIMKSESASVVADRAPCISTVAPIVPPAGMRLPVMDQTLFQVPVVDDDLDSYPRTPNGSLYGEATFLWSIVVSGGPRTVVGTGPNFLFDPSAYAPMTPVDLRVEIQDRKLTPVNCPDGDDTCALGGVSSCIQRQTWRVEAR